MKIASQRYRARYLGYILWNVIVELDVREIGDYTYVERERERESGALPCLLLHRSTL